MVCFNLHFIGQYDPLYAINNIGFSLAQIPSCLLSSSTRANYSRVVELGWCLNTFLLLRGNT